MVTGKSNYFETSTSIEFEMFHDSIFKHQSQLYLTQTIFSDNSIFKHTHYV